MQEEEKESNFRYVFNPEFTEQMQSYNKFKKEFDKTRHQKLENAMQRLKKTKIDVWKYNHALDQSI